MSTSEGRRVMPAPIPIPKPPPEAPRFVEVIPPWERGEPFPFSPRQTISSRAAAPNSAGNNQIGTPKHKYRRNTAKNCLLEILEKDKAERMEAKAKMEEERKKGMVYKVLSLIKTE